MESYVTSHPSKVKVCFTCYRAYPRFLGNVRAECEDIPVRETDARVKMTLRGKCATILAIIGSKQQLSVFPETLESCAAVGGKRRERSVGVALGDTLGFDDSEDSDSERSQDQAHEEVDSSIHAECNGVTGAAATSASRDSKLNSGGDLRLEQIRQLDVWTERFFDGSLKRLVRVQQWPDWH